MALPYIPNIGDDPNHVQHYCDGVECYLEHYQDLFIADPLVAAGQAALGAAATIAIFEYQKSQRDDIAKDMRDTVDEALSNYCDSIQECLDSDAFECAYPDVPGAAEYVPVDSCLEKGFSYQCVKDLACLAETTATKVNKAQVRNSLQRAVFLDPKYRLGVDLRSCQVSDLLSQVSPLGKRIGRGLVSNRLEKRFPGITNTRNLRSMGISRMSAASLGRVEQIRELMFMNDVSPISRNLDITSLMVTPEQRISMALTQAQLIQNSSQNALNQASLKPPAKLAELQTKLQKIVATLSLDASKANLISQYVPNYAGILQPQIGSIVNGLGGFFGGNGSGGTSNGQQGLAVQN